MSTTRSRATWAVLNALGLALALTANGLASGLPLNGLDTGEISALYPNLFVPAGLTFSIWGLIYLGLVALVAYTATGVRDPGERDLLGAIGPWFLVSCLANAAWIFAWHWTLVGLSVLIMLVLLASLVALYLRLGIGTTPAPPAETWLVRVPISVYLGWITVATIANVTALAVDLGAPSFGTGPAWATVAVMAVATAITGGVLWTRRDVAYGLVVVWAFLGIFLERSESAEAGSATVAMAALAGLVVVLVGIVAAVSGGRRNWGAAW